MTNVNFCLLMSQALVMVLISYDFPLFYHHGRDVEVEVVN